MSDLSQLQFYQDRDGWHAIYPPHGISVKAPTPEETLERFEAAERALTRRTAVRWTIAVMTAYLIHAAILIWVVN